jgi:hypothetical protein
MQRVPFRNQHRKDVGEMKQQSEPPSQALMQAFAKRLAEFRDTLPDDQQQLLDTMVVAALAPPWASDEETEAYWARYKGVLRSPNAVWYTGSGAAA